MKKIPVIIDCDPGLDDAVAIFLALSSDRIDVRAITAVAGNQTVDKTLNNVLKLLNAAGRLDIPVGRGASRPLVQHQQYLADYVHGESGLGRTELPLPDPMPPVSTAFDLLVKILETSEEKVTICPIGPLTNLAHLFIVRPDLKARIERLSIMGGAASCGNITPVAEFNIYADPEAADVVFASGVPIVMSGLDVTHRAYITPGEVERLKALVAGHGGILAEMIDFLSKTDHSFTESAGSPIHDACAIAVLLWPELFQSRNCHVDIELAGDLTRGMTVVNLLNIVDQPANAEVLLDVDRQAFAEALIQTLSAPGRLELSGGSRS